MFSNPIDMDDDQLKNGCSMIIDPFGGIIAECRTLGDDYISATLTPEKLKQSGDTGILKPEGLISIKTLLDKLIYRNKLLSG